MPANLSPEYKAAEAAFRSARDPKERLECLREMLRTIPKHKGTDHLQADIKRRISELTDELAGPRKKAARHGPVTVLRPEGAAQIALLGPPNSGKSSLHAHLTGSEAQVGPFPFTTQLPLPGMLPYQDVNLQLVDLPPIAVEHPVPWIANALQPADAALLVVDLTEPECIERVGYLLEVLRERRVYLSASWDDPDEPLVAVQEADPFAKILPALLVAAKADLDPDPQEDLRVFEDLVGLSLPRLAVSVVTGEGLDRLGPWLFEKLHVVRVYTKAPGRPPDRDKPFTVRRGDTVAQVAALVHQDIAADLKFARLWRGEDAHGLQVGRDYPVEDGDILELHA